MKKVLQLGLLFCFCVAANAQRVYFVYIQSENNSPFYVKFNDKILSSSSSGYLILPQLKDSTYSFFVGKTGNKNSEAKFSVSINNNDKGFLLKNYQDELSLFDMQSMAVINPVSKESKAAEATVRKEDPFTKLLAQAANDSSLLTQPVIAKKEAQAKVEEKKEIKPQVEVAKTETVNENAVINNTNTEVATTQNEQSEKEVKVEENKKVEEVKVEETNKEELVKKEDVKTEEIKKAEPVVETQKSEPVKEVSASEYKRSIISRRSESSTTEGFGLVFLDNDAGEIDTIRILIPNPKTIIKSEPQKEQTDIKFLEITSNTDKKSSSDVINSKQACKNVASDNDFKKLRRNMASENTDEKMINEAKDNFKKKCYTTEQIKNLSTLFLSNNSKLQFFEVAYNYVSDKDQFASLINELSDDNYKSRFKALTATEL